MQYGFGVDIYGPQIKIGFFDASGKLLHKWKINTPMQNSGNDILPAVAAEIDRYLTKKHIFEDDVLGIGVGIPGPVNSTGTVNKCINFGWGVFNINRALSGLTGLPVASGNIASIAALGECWRGNSSKNMVFAALNTGLGGAVVCNGNVVLGAQGGGGELGHMIINKNEKEACTCGKRGCVEQYCSPTGILRLAKRQLLANATPSVLRNRPLTDYHQVLDAAADGDRIAKTVMDQFYDYMGHFLSNVCCVTNPDKVVLGGEFCRMGPSLLENVAKAFHKYIFHANENVRFEYAKLGTDASIYGAFKLVLDSFGH